MTSGTGRGTAPGAGRGEVSWVGRGGAPTRRGGAPAGTRVAGAPPGAGGGTAAGARAGAPVAAARRGTTTIAGKAVRKIAERAAGEVLPAPAAGTVSGSATVRGRRASVALRAALPYPAPLSETAREVQRHVADRVRGLTGLETGRVDLTVTGLRNPPALPAPAAPSPPLSPRPSGQPAGRLGLAPPFTPAEQVPTEAARPAVRQARRRWWSARRGPMAALTLTAAAACAAVTADVIRVHATGRPAAAWRTGLLDWLSGHGPGGTPVTIAGALLALAGAWLLVLACTPGRRHQLTLTPPAPGWNVAVDRSTVAALVRDAVERAGGISTATVRVRRGRVTVRARLAFGDLPTAREQATAAARRTLADCPLRRAPGLRVTVTPEPAWQPPGGTGTSVTGRSRRSGEAGGGGTDAEPRDVIGDGPGGAPGGEPGGARRAAPGDAPDDGPGHRSRVISGGAPAGPPPDAGRYGPQGAAGAARPLPERAPGRDTEAFPGGGPGDHAGHGHGPGHDHGHDHDRHQDRHDGGERR
ncbi:Asp23/Gls24 family envelope stress response protein [Streptomyces zingiberis]|uniref:Asp23/Gls24 family envelope stress response protein n=1 Tax=Streptomyces zingiberis TaxID=2053010 RepID=A0ABX1C023_9ACTN|nr:DUF6286 domain-containing protein [Streptomyces zingiberis]NJQ01152.1 Asp23/Gls24 family envelope stress response protein [Streptomyces zingiberis]